MCTEELYVLSCTQTCVFFLVQILNSFSASLPPPFTSAALTPQLLAVPAAACQSGWEEWGLWGHAAVLRSPGTGRPELLLKDGEKTLSFHCGVWR